MRVYLLPSSPILRQKLTGLYTHGPSGPTTVVKPLAASEPKGQAVTTRSPVQGGAPRGLEPEPHAPKELGLENRRAPCVGLLLACVYLSISRPVGAGKLFVFN